MLFERVAILGVGLIGGSFALALKEARACSHVVGAGRSAANLRHALELCIIDSTAPDAVAATHNADLVLVATPVAQFLKLFREIASVLGPKAVITDGGSTKRDVVSAARAALGRKIAQFVPAHPIAGAERSGADAASAALFRDRRAHHAHGAGGARRGARRGEPPAARAGVRAGARARLPRARRAALRVR